MHSFNKFGIQDVSNLNAKTSGAYKQLTKKKEILRDLFLFVSNKIV